MKRALTAYFCALVLTDISHAASFTFAIQVNRALIDNGQWQPADLKFEQTWNIVIDETFTSRLRGSPPYVTVGMNGVGLLEPSALSGSLHDYIDMAEIPGDNSYHNARLYKTFTYPVGGTPIPTYYFALEHFSRAETPVGDGTTDSRHFESGVWGEGSIPIWDTATLDYEGINRALTAIGPLNWFIGADFQNYDAQHRYTPIRRIHYEGTATIITSSVPEPNSLALACVGAVALGAYVRRNRGALPATHN